MEHTNPIRRACTLGATIALVGLSAGVGALGVTSASAAELPATAATATASPATDGAATGTTGTTTSTTATSPADVATTTAGQPGTDGTGSDTGATGTGSATGSATAGTDAAGSGSTSATSPDTTGTGSTSGAGTSGAGASGASTTGTGTGGTAGTGTDAGSTGTSTTGTGTSTAGTDTTATTTSSTTPPTTTATSAPAAQETAGSVRVEGSPRVTATLTAVVGGGWSEGTTFSYQWLRNGEPIAGATSATYTLVDDDQDTAIDVVVTGTSADGSSSATATAGARMLVQPADAPAFADDAVTVRAVAGQPLSYTVTADGDRPITYSTDMVGYGLPDGITFDDGVISGTTDVAGATTFTVRAENADGFAEQLVTLDVLPAPTSGLTVFLTDAPDDPDGDFWYADTDGDTSGPVTVADGRTLSLGAVLHDAYGNETGEGDVGAVISSSAAADVVTQPDALGSQAATVVLHGAGVRTVTYRSGGYTLAVRVTVPGTVSVPPVAGTPTVPTSTTGSVPTVSGATTVAVVAPVTHTTDPTSLAFTGSDAAAPLGWATAFLAAGAAVTGLRFRRRRTQR